MKLTDDVQDRIVAAVRAGNTVEVAAASVGVDPATYQRWMASGELARGGRQHRFWVAVTQARAEGEVVLVARIATAARNGSWGAAAFLLERRHPERWARDRDEPQPPKELSVVDDIAAARAQRRARLAAPTDQ